MFSVRFLVKNKNTTRGGVKMNLPFTICVNFKEFSLNVNIAGLKASLSKLKLRIGTFIKGFGKRQGAYGLLNGSLYIPHCTLSTKIHAADPTEWNDPVAGLPFSNIFRSSPH